MMKKLKNWEINDKPKSSDKRNETEVSSSKNLIKIFFQKSVIGY